MCMCTQAVIYCRKPQLLAAIISTPQIAGSSSAGCSGFGPTYTKIGTIQRRLAWPLRKDDTQIREAFQIFFGPLHTMFVIFLEQSLLKATSSSDGLLIHV